MAALPAVVVALVVQLLVLADLVALVARLPLPAQPLLVPADLALVEARLPVLAHLLVLVVLPHKVVEEQLPVPALLVVEAELLVQRLPSRQSFSAAMARSSPPAVQPTYGRAPSTRSPPKGQTCPSP